MLKQISLLNKTAVVLVIISIALIAYGKLNPSNVPFAQAKDFPEGALVYAQFQDLPALYKSWDESELKQNYLASTNFAEFENNHLALKLLSRLNEFETASGFPLGVSSFLNSSETKAAIAVYDIGRLEFVFVAPLSEEKLLLSEFVINRSGFAEETLSDGTVYYSKDVDADRGRQRQKLLFAVSNGRFVLATDELHFFKTLALLGGKSKDNNLFNAPEFKFLSDKIEPHLATIWVDQRKLNNDWYFKHYWMFKNIESLKQTRSGIFDFEMQENKLIERRTFLLNGKPIETRKISAIEIDNLRKFIPEDVPDFKIKAIDSSSDSVAKEIRNSLLDGFVISENRHVRGENHYNRYYFEDYSENYWETNYRYLGGKYEAEINENEEASEITEGVLRSEDQLIADLNRIVQAASPKVSANLINPQIMPVPLFFECQRAVVITLGNAGNLNRENLEQAISDLANNQLAVREDSVNLEWTTAEKNGKTWRELNFPMLGWKLIYSIEKNHIIFANGEDLFKSILETNATQQPDLKGDYDEFTTIRFNQLSQAFRAISTKIRQEESKGETEVTVDFFADNVGSLLDVLTGLNRVEIRKTSANNYLTEEVEFIFD
jgi:hypothetical protein